MSGISFEDLIKNPGNYSPLGSKKGTANKPTAVQFDQVNITDVFLSESNKLLLVSNMQRYALSQGITKQFETFASLIDRFQLEFLSRHDIASYKMAEYAVGLDNWVEVLKVANGQFIKFFSDKLPANTFLPSRAGTYVKTNTGTVWKQYTDLLASDYGSINVDGNYTVPVMNVNSRGSNAIPTYRTALHTRHYDRDNDGLADTNVSSRENFQRGFNMSEIIQTVDEPMWTKDGWYGV